MLIPGKYKTENVYVAISGRRGQLQYALALEQAKSMASKAPRHNLSDAIDELETDFNAIDENEAIEKIKNWIENA